MKENWINGNKQKYQLIGDNWDKNILPSYRTSQNKTLSLHLFHVIAVVDRIIPTPKPETAKSLSITDYIPSLEEQEVLIKELTFLVATSVVQNLDQINKSMIDIYPKHFQHEHSDAVGRKTQQVRKWIILKCFISIPVWYKPFHFQYDEIASIV